MAGSVPLRLPFSVKEIFSEWLLTHRPDRRDKVLAAVRDVRGGKLNDSDFKSRMRGEGARADNIRSMFHLFTTRLGFNQTSLELRTDLFTRPPQAGEQTSFF